MKNEETKAELLYCSFCGKSQEEVVILIAGSDSLEGKTPAHICGECVRLCVNLVVEQLTQKLERAEDELG